MMMRTNVLDILFPPHCAVCDRVIQIGEAGICSNCKGKLSYTKEPRCMKCGKEIPSDDEEYCYDCKEKKRSYVMGFPVFNYVPPVSDALMAFKYHNKQEYASFYAREIVKRFGAELRRLELDAIVPVPIHKKKYATRGYNQTELLARELEKLINVPTRAGMLKRVSDTPPQKELGDEARERNMQGVFVAELPKEPVATVLLVDDIYTTGATIESCTKALMEIGVKKVYYTSVCIGQLYN